MKPTALLCKPSVPNHQSPPGLVPALVWSIFITSVTELIVLALKGTMVGLAVAGPAPSGSMIVLDVMKSNPEPAVFVDFPMPRRAAPASSFWLNRMLKVPMLPVVAVQLTVAFKYKEFSPAVVLGGVPLQPSLGTKSCVVVMAAPPAARVKSAKV